MFFLLINSLSGDLVKIIMLDCRSKVGLQSPLSTVAYGFLFEFVVYKEHRIADLKEEPQTL